MRALRWAAVLGAEFTVTDLEVASGQSVGDLMGMIGAALRAGVLADAGTRLEFRHGLIRQALYEAMPPALQASMHIQAARALAATGAAAERVASQLAAARQASGPRAELASDWAANWLAKAASVLNYRAPRVTAELLDGVLGQLADDDDRREILQANALRAESSQLSICRWRVVDRCLRNRDRARFSSAGTLQSVGGYPADLRQR